MTKTGRLLLSFSSCLRHAFFTGAGYGDLEKISEDDQKKWVTYEPPEVGAFVTMHQVFERLEKLEQAVVPLAAIAPFMKHAENLASWVEAALQCDSWQWDFDQFEAALSVLNEYRDELGDEPITLEKMQEIRRLKKERREANG